MALTAPLSQVNVTHLDFTRNCSNIALGAVLATSEVIPSRAMRALEGEGRGLSHLEVAARGAVVAPASQ
jgi:hypothetical protein